jgi:hypothetical protein
MRRLALLAFTLATPACADVPDWREEADMAGVQYIARVPADGSGLFVDGWRNDGGLYLSEDLHSIATYSVGDRLAVSTEAFRRREAGGVPAWTITGFWSHPADREDAGVNTLCGIGADMAGWEDASERVVALVDWSDAPRDQEIHHDGVFAAARVDLETGAITPIPVDDVYCYQELL